MLQKGKAKINFELDGEKVKVEISGNGKDLLDLCCNAMNKNPNIRTMFELSVMTMKRFDEQQQENGDMDGLAEALMMMMMGSKQGMN